MSDKEKQDPQNKKKLIIIISIILLFSIGGIGGFLYYKKQQAQASEQEVVEEEVVEEETVDKEKKKDQKKKKTVKKDKYPDLKPEYFKLAEATVNLSDPGGGRFIQAEVQLYFKSKSNLTKYLEERKPLWVHHINMFVSSKNADYFLEMPTKDLYREELLESLLELMDKEIPDEVLKESQIKEILFTKLIIQ